MFARIRQLREELQGPRRKIDTFYGKHVMRKLSIYLTELFSHTPLEPTHVTFLSLAAGLAGAYFLSQGEWVWGVVGVNGWYLLDHVDGELARLKKRQSATGLYFDTLANAFVFPATFVGLGLGLDLFGYENAASIGVCTAFSALILILVDFCESATLFQLMLKNSTDARPRVVQPEASSENPQILAPGRVFGGLHVLVSFPYFLMGLTALTLISGLMRPSAFDKTLFTLLKIYGVLITLVWAGILAAIWFHRKVDQKLEKILARTP